LYRLPTPRDGPSVLMLLIRVSEPVPVLPAAGDLHLLKASLHSETYPWAAFSQAAVPSLAQPANRTTTSPVSYLSPWSPPL